MSLPPRFSGMPEEEQHKHFRNICIEFQKALKNSKDPEELEMKMQKFLGAARHMSWPREKTAIFHKDEYEKALQKVWKEFKRYVEALIDEDPIAPQDLIDSLTNVESMVDKLKTR